MEKLIMVAVLIAGSVSPTPAVASLTSAQLTDQCRPQLERMVANEIAEQQAAIESSRRNAAETPELKQSSAEAIRGYEKGIADLRSKGIGEAENQAMINDILRKLPSAGKATIREAIADAKTYSDPTSAATVCLMEAVLANIEGRSPSGVPAPTAVPALRPTVSLPSHNPANEASDCLELITSREFDSKGIRSNMGAVLRNRCAFRVEMKWCVGEERCASWGYDNLDAVPANDYKPISYDAPKGVKVRVRWGACRLGFEPRPDLQKTLFYACK